MFSDSPSFSDKSIEVEKVYGLFDFRRNIHGQIKEKSALREISLRGASKHTPMLASTSTANGTVKPQTRLGDLVSDCLVCGLTTVSHILKKQTRFQSSSVNSFPDLGKICRKETKSVFAIFININLNETQLHFHFLLFYEHIHIYFALTSSLRS